MTRRDIALAHAAGEANPFTWHVAVTNPRYETLVRQQMQARGIDTVLPLVRYWRERGRRRFEAEKPLMPRYLIFGLDRTMQSCAGIVGLERVVRDRGEVWAELRSDLVYDLRLRILVGEFDGTLDRAVRPLSPIVEWLVARGELGVRSVWTAAKAKKAGLRTVLAA